MPVTWEFISTQSMSRNMNNQKRRPSPDSGNYVADVLSVFDKPQEKVQLAATAVELSDLTAIQTTIYGRGGATTYTMPDGTVLIGVPEGETHQRIEGTTLYNVTVSVHRTDF